MNWNRLHDMVRYRKRFPRTRLDFYDDNPRHYGWHNPHG